MADELISIGELDESLLANLGAGAVFLGQDENGDTVKIPVEQMAESVTGALTDLELDTLDVSGATTLSTLETSGNAELATAEVLGKFTQGGAEAAAGAKTDFAPYIKSAITNAVATTIATVTIPNLSLGARLRFEVTAAMGAGTNAYECVAFGSIEVIVARVAGANGARNTAGDISSFVTTISGGNSLTLTFTVTSVTGGTTADNTFTIQVTISRNAGAGTNHKAVIEASMRNFTSPGVTVVLS